MKIKIGVMGAFRGLATIKFLLKYEDAELVAVCDKFLPALEKVRAAAEAAGMNVALYEDFDASCSAIWTPWCWQTMPRSMLPMPSAA